MNIILTQQEQTAAISEFSEILGFYIAFEEGSTVKERSDSFAKKYPMFIKIREQIIYGKSSCDEVVPPGKLKPNGKKKEEPESITE